MKPIKAYQGYLLMILKLILTVVTLGFIGYKLVYAYHFGQLWSELDLKLSFRSVIILLITFLLMPFNWYSESEKWKIIFRKHEHISNKKAYKSVLTGITLGIITPNQIGILAGKSMYLESLSKLKGAVASLMGEVAQTIITLVIGSYGSLALYFHLHEVDPFVYLPCYAALTGVNSMIIFLFLNIPFLQKFRKWKWLNQYLPIATNYSKPELFRILILSFARFAIFTFQYYLLLLFFNVNLSPAQWAMSIFSIYIVQSFAPSFILLQIGVRGALALYFIGIFTDNTVGILLSAYSLWIINVMIPGIAGLYFLLTYKLNTKS